MKGIFMMGNLILFSKSHSEIVFILACIVILVSPKHSYKWYLFSATFWPVMEIVILLLANGGAWTYNHQELVNIPFYLAPMWSLVSDCIVQFYEFGVLNEII